jgi:DNA-binding NtrC family response regulator
MTRQVAIVAKGSLFDRLHIALNSAGWLAYRASEYEPVLFKNSGQTIHAGLVELSGVDKAEISRYRQLTSSNDEIEWIALVLPDILSDKAVCKLIKTHFHDFHTLPIDVPRLLLTLGHAHGKGLLDGLCNEPIEKNGQYGMIGTSKAMRKLYQHIAKISDTDAPVLISGESGTGKELAARAIHQLSPRKEGPFIAVNCAALPENLIQSELFGHEKGAFTGAYQRKIGRMEAATGGTIFLDEIGDLPKPLQVNLLRILQEQVIERLGSNREINLNVRMIAASHVNLELAVQAGTFREDLYYRLNVLGLKSPPLREREDDVEILATHFFEKFSAESRSAARGYSDSALRVMNRYSWPGNVRELINRVRQAVIMSENRLLNPANLGLEKRIICDISLTLEQARAHADNEIIRSALRRNKNNVSEAARQLGVSRATLYRLLQQTKLKPSTQKPGAKSVQEDLLAML